MPEERLSLVPGLRVTEIVQEGSPVHGLFVMGENPIISDPDIAHAEEWFHNLDFVAVQDLFLTETARYADVVLPGASFAEKTGTVVNTERRIQLMHKAIDPPGDARGDLEILIELSNRVGLPTPFENSAEVMDEIARVTPSWRGVSHARLAGGGLQYPVEDAHHPGTDFLFANHFPTSDGKATLVAGGVPAAGRAAGRGVPILHEHGTPNVPLAHGHHDAACARDSMRASRHQRSS